MHVQPRPYQRQWQVVQSIIGTIKDRMNVQQCKDEGASRWGLNNVYGDKYMLQIPIVREVSMIYIYILK